ncbi:hypothetical protein J7E71_19040 [Mesobacillus foraminis]|uniref:hypothetical protein n=1 Tax=Mesobacillus foraminis TaxID=279826 RepID=UPI001BEC8C20|nr:hypothetical protein [Mesobacillus foraminis]MBT2757971.1 hypothetical protein [Mesobacillus foraminis]
MTCFGSGGQGDSNDNWRVEVEGGGPWNVQRQVPLVHLNTNHAIQPHRGHSDSRWTASKQEVSLLRT